MSAAVFLFLAALAIPTPIGGQDPSGPIPVGEPPIGAWITAADERPVRPWLEQAQAAGLSTLWVLTPTELRRFPLLEAGAGGGEATRLDPHPRAMPPDFKALEELYFATVGAGEPLTLILPLDKGGNIAGAERGLLGQLATLRRRILDQDWASGCRALASHALPDHPPQALNDGDPGSFWQAPPGTSRCFVDLVLPRAVVIDTLLLCEPPEAAGHITSYELKAQRDNLWVDLPGGGTIGTWRLRRIPPGRYQALRLIVNEAKGAPALATIGLYTAPPEVEIHADERVFMGATRVRFSTSNPDALVRYTLDGTRPTAASALYTSPLSIDRPCVVTALAWCEGDEGLVPVSVRLRAYTKETLPPPDAQGATPGLAVRAWSGAASGLDAVDWEAEGVEQLLVADLDAASQLSAGALLLEGLIHAPRGGIYSFFAAGARELRLEVGGEDLLDCHGPSETMGQIGLAAGWHRLRVEVLRSEGSRFEIQWRGPAIGKRPIAAEELGR